MNRQPRIGQPAVFGPLTYQIGRVSAIRANGFYVRHTNSHPTVPGGRKYGQSSIFFRFDQIGPNGYSNKTSDWMNKTAQVTLHELESESESEAQA